MWVITKPIWKRLKNATIRKKNREEPGGSEKRWMGATIVPLPPLLLYFVQRLSLSASRCRRPICDYAPMCMMILPSTSYGPLQEGKGIRKGKEETFRSKTPIVRVARRVTKYWRGEGFPSGRNKWTPQVDRRTLKFFFGKHRLLPQTSK